MNGFDSLPKLGRVRVGLIGKTDLHAWVARARFSSALAIKRRIVTPYRPINDQALNPRNRTTLAIKEIAGI